MKLSATCVVDRIVSLAVLTVAALAAFALHAVTIGDVTFTPTHVWTGAAGTTAFATVGNWSDANGVAAADAPGAGSVVYIPAPASGDRTVVVSSAFSIGALYIGRDGTAAGTVTLRFDHCKNNSVAGDVHLFAGATLTAKEAPDNTITTFAQEASSSYKVNIVAGGSFTIDSGASVDVSCKGFSKGKPSGYCGGDRNGGPGAFAGITLAERAKVNTWTACGSTPYGSVYFPTNLAPTTTLKLFGGGATYLHADGNFVLNGSVLSNPYHGGTFIGESCSSGGSILIECATLSGNGSISAAPQRSVSIHSGGGGRIAVHQSVASDMSAFTGSIKANSASSGDRHCGAGTIYLRFAGQSLGDGELIVDNNSVSCSSLQVTELTEDNIEFGKVTVRNGGRLHLRDGQTLRVRRAIDATGGSITNDATAVFDCSYPNEIHFAGKTAFSNFVCTNDQATLRFAAGSANLFTANVGGRFLITGSAQRRIPLLGDPQAETWYASCPLNAEVDISHVAVSNSDATVGYGFLAIDSHDLGGNESWSFSRPVLPGDPITWTGAANSQWSNSANWLDKHGEAARAALATDVVTIPAGCPNYPEIAANSIVEAAGLSVAGAITVGAGSVFTVNGDVSVSGSLVLGDRTELESSGNVTFADGSTFTGARSRLTLFGAGSQSVDLDGKALNQVSVYKSGGAVALSDSFSCGILDIRATGAASVLFPAAKTVSANVFLAAGYVAGAAVLELGPVGGSGTWGLNVGEKGLVTSAVVTGCDAGGGIAVIADTRSTLSGCSNWSQPGRVHIWNGAKTGGAYGTASNWTPDDGQIAGSRLAAVAYAAMTISQTAAASPESLDIFAGEYSVAFNSTAALSVSEGLEARTNVTMSLGKPVTVGGDVVFRRGSALTHSGHGSNDSTQLYAVNITSGGKVTIEPQVSVNVVSKGFAKQRGPGYNTSGASGPCVAHGGRRLGWKSGYSSANCYGSILAPVTVGSGGYGQPGGGAVKIAAAGRISLESSINACGTSSQYAPSAGSVFLSCSRLEGTGSLYAYAADFNSSHAGSGGRIAVVQTEATDFSAWSGVADAHGAYYARYFEKDYLGGAGTVYLKSAGSNGQVIIENRIFVSAQETQIPMADDGNAATAYANVDFLVPSNMTISLLGDTTIHDLDLKATTSRLKLNGYTLTIKSGRHRDGKRWGAPYSSLVTEGGGTVVWIGKPGFLISVH